MLVVAFKLTFHAMQINNGLDGHRSNKEAITYEMILVCIKYQPENAVGCGQVHIAITKFR